MACSPDRQHVWSGGDDRTLRSWQLPAPDSIDPRQIMQRIQRLTGMSLGPRQTTTWLDADTWNQLGEAVRRAEVAD